LHARTALEPRQRGERLRTDPLAVVLIARHLDQRCSDAIEVTGLTARKAGHRGRAGLQGAAGVARDVEQSR
jgi:hypothetical protein